jgi:hypothetical protein
MADWIDNLGDVIFHIAEPFMHSTRPKRLLGIVLAAITAFAVIGTLIAVSLDTKLDPVGYFVLIPLLLTTSSIACYCFVTDRGQ